MSYFSITTASRSPPTRDGAPLALFDLSL